MVDEGPRDAAESILLLPGGMCSARLFVELTAEPALSRTRRVAYEMAVSGAFKGPVVLLGSSRSSADGPALFRVIISLGSVLGTLPATLLKKAAAALAGQAKISADRQRELKADFDRNDPRVMRLGLRAYMHWLRRDDNRAQRLCDAGNRTWVVHSEKGDGALTRHERAVLEACDHVQVITLPGRSFFLPIEESAAIASLITGALAPAG